MKKYHNKYRIQSNRMPGWDYAGNGYYFITLVVKNMECVLGKIVDNQMVLSEFGKIVDDEWKKSFEIRDELFLDTYQIMPNHLHAIIVIRQSRKNKVKEETARDKNKVLYRKPKSLSSFIAGFKSAVNSKIDDYIDKCNLDIPKYNIKNPFFLSNYHDHVIRDFHEYLRIERYIINNPAKWNKDRFKHNGK